MTARNAERLWIEGKFVDSLRAARDAVDRMAQGEPATPHDLRIVSALLGGAATSLNGLITLPHQIVKAFYSAKEKS